MESRLGQKGIRNTEFYNFQPIDFISNCFFQAIDGVLRSAKIASLFAILFPTIFKHFPRLVWIFVIFVERCGHKTQSQIKSLLYSVTCKHLQYSNNKIKRCLGPAGKAIHRVYLCSGAFKVVWYFVSNV